MFERINELVFGDKYDRQQQAVCWVIVVISVSYILAHCIVATYRAFAGAP